MFISRSILEFQNLKYEDSLRTHCSQNSTLSVYETPCDQVILSHPENHWNHQALGELRPVPNVN